MSTAAPSLRIAIYGPDEPARQRRQGYGPWPPGYAAAVKTAGGTPVALALPKSGRSWGKLLQEVDGLVCLRGYSTGGQEALLEERLVDYCHEVELPFLGVDEGMQLLNAAYGGSLYADLARELPQALQHRHPPEQGLRHAIEVLPGTRLARLYGEGEIVVNSEHRRAVANVARGFRVSARALDGVVEAIEPDRDGWFAVGVQWQPASASASGLDIQLFRGLVEAGRQRQRAVAAA